MKLIEDAKETSDGSLLANAYKCVQKNKPRDFCPQIWAKFGQKNTAFSFYQARLPRLERGTYGLEGLKAY